MSDRPPRHKPGPEAQIVRWIRLGLTQQCDEALNAHHKATGQIVSEIIRQLLVGPPPEPCPACGQPAFPAVLVEGILLCRACGEPEAREIAHDMRAWRNLKRSL